MTNELEKFIQKNFKMSKDELVKKYSKVIIKSGSKIIKQTNDFELVGVRNSRDKRWSLNLMFDCNSTSQSVNYENVRIAQGVY
jgi:hypothetical protein